MLTNSSSRRIKKKPRFVVFADFYSVHAFSLHCWLQATNHCRAGNWYTKSALTICMSPLQHTTAPTSANYHLQAQTESFVLVPNSNLLECHILLTSSKAKWTHNLPVNLFPYSRFHTVCAQALSHVRLFVTPWTVARQAPLSMEFSQQEYWTGLPCLSPGDLPNLGIEPRSLALQADSLPSEPSGKLFLW